ncbi:MAG TPA: hypothetical protein VH044_06810 [Polyangiaceae bacterium]|jgi:hypothetical protein|nr:hypothetical protein [Polyangiaceae bacterium]
MRAEYRSPVLKCTCPSAAPAALAAPIFAFACVAVCATACSTQTTETNVWKSPTAAAGTMKNIAVFAGRVNPTDRHTLEDGFVASLATYGVRATPSYSIFPESPVPPDATSVQKTLQSSGFDGALVSTLQGVTERVSIDPYSDWAGGFYGAYWGPGAPVYAETDQFVKFETTVWNVSAGKMVWSALTQTVNPKSGQDFVASLTKAVTPSIAKAGLIPSRNGGPISMLP